jgi:hypothetical protein
MDNTPEKCVWCIHWNWEQNTCGVSIDCLNRVLQGKDASRFTDLRNSILVEMRKVRKEITG